MTNDRAYLARSDVDLIETIQTALDGIDWHSIIPQNSKVFIKTNLTWPSYKPGVTTSPLVIDAFLSVLKRRTDAIYLCESDKGYLNQSCIESLRGNGLDEILQRHGVSFVNLSEMPVREVTDTVRGKEIKIPLPEPLLGDDVIFISMPVLKTHSLTGISAGMKNQYGCVQHAVLPLYHHMINEVLAVANRHLNPRLVVVDATYAQDGNGPFFGQPVLMDTLIVTNGIRASEPVACALMGIDMDQVPHLKFAREEGLVAGIEDVELNADIKDFAAWSFKDTRTWLNQFSYLVFRRYWLSKLVYDSPLTGLAYAAANILRRKKIG
ncbi:MAG: DUF362 domain-containing protein [Actinomycetota bacterium]